MPFTCLNCGSPVREKFCPRCGQGKEDRRGPLMTLFGDFLSEFFSLDGRLVRTASALVRPGRATEYYLEGKRASYLTPIRVYLVSSLLFFFLVGFPAPDASKYNVWVDDELMGREEADPSLGNMQLTMRSEGWLSQRAEPLFAHKRDQLRALPPQDLLDGLFTGLERTVPTALIFFVPILALALKLLYVRQPFYYVDHLVAAFHFQSFLFLTLVVAFLLNQLGLGRLYPGLFTYLAAVFLVAPTYLVFALKRIYKQSWWRTLLKGGLLAVLYLLIAQPVTFATFVLVIRGI